MSIRKEPPIALIERDDARASNKRRSLMASHKYKGGKVPPKGMHMMPGSKMPMKDTDMDAMMAGPPRMMKKGKAKKK